MAKLSKADINSISRAQKEALFPGTEENGYADAGIWEFIKHVYTKDEHDSTNPVKKLIGAGDTYIIIVILYMLACESLLLPKSRQIRMSWVSCAFAVWHAMSGKFRRVGYQTKKESDASEQTSLGTKDPGGGRMDFIIQHLPEWLRDPNILSGKGNLVGSLNFSPDAFNGDGLAIPWQGSKIHGMPQGANQARQYTFSLYISDESAFQDEYRESMVAVSAAAVGGGKDFSISSVDSGSFFNQSVLNIKGGGDVEHREINPIVQKGMDILGLEWPKGMRSWQTASGAWVLEINYRADPHKDPDRLGKEWHEKAVMRPGYEGSYDSDGWQTEMEINYGRGGGTPVFPMIIPGCKMLIDGYRPEEIMNNHRFFAGYDYGSQNPSALEVLAVDAASVVKTAWELYEPCRNVADHVERIKRCPYWERIEWIAADPSIMAQTQQTASGLKTLAEIFEMNGLYLEEGRRGQDVTVAHMIKSMYWNDLENPTFLLTKATPHLIKEMKNLRYEKFTSAAVELRRNASEKIRQKDNHGVDAVVLALDYGVEAFHEVRKVNMKGTFAQAVKDLRLDTARKQERGGIRVW